jgi:hypothetical protein
MALSTAPLSAGRFHDGLSGARHASRQHFHSGIFGSDSRILLPVFETMTASLSPEGSQGACLGVLNAAGELGGSAGYYVGSWLVLNRSPVETWLSFGAVGLPDYCCPSFYCARTTCWMPERVLQKAESGAK